MIGKILVVVTIVLWQVPLFGQNKITWDDLTDVYFEEKYYEDINEYLLYPTFGEEVRKLQNTDIEITGFIIPIEADQTVYILSRNPYSSCFFCGQAGPETIIELELASPPKKAYELDDIMTFEGTFRLNDSDVDHCNYILEDARVVK